MTKILVSYERETRLPEWATPEVLLLMHDKEGKTLRELARITGVSHTTIGKIIARARKATSDV